MIRTLAAAATPNPWSRAGLAFRGWIFDRVTTGLVISNIK